MVPLPHIPLILHPLIRFCDLYLHIAFFYLQAADRFVPMVLFTSMIVCTIACLKPKTFAVAVRLECRYAKVCEKRCVKLIEYLSYQAISMFTDGAALFNPVINFFRPLNRTHLFAYFFL